MIFLGGFVLGLSIAETLEVSGSVVVACFVEPRPKGSSPSLLVVVVVVEIPRPKGVLVDILVVVVWFWPTTLRVRLVWHGSMRARP